MKRYCANGRACASGSQRTARAVACAATSPNQPTSGRQPAATQDALYRGARLAAALDWTAEHEVELNELERAFVTESREASEQETRRVRRTNRRLRGLLIGVAVLLAAAIGGGIYAVVQRGQARDAADTAQASAEQAKAAGTAQLAQRLGAQALLTDELGRSLLLARQSVDLDDSPQTRGNLLAALLLSPAAVEISPRAEDFGLLALSPDGRRLAVREVRGSVRLFLFDAESLELVGDPLALLETCRPVSRTVRTGARSPSSTGAAMCIWRCSTPLQASSGRRHTLPQPTSGGWRTPQMAGCSQRPRRP